MTQYAFFFDQSRCINCHACSIACKDWNDLEPGPVKWLRRYEWEKGVFPNVKHLYLFASCYHCENAVCIDACKHNAIFKEDKYGAVLVDQDKCAGDRNCYKVCPYGAPQFKTDEPGEKMSKCTMCIERLEDGKLPICVESCPLRALDFGPIEEMIQKYGNLRRLEDMPNPEGIKPSIVFKPMGEKKPLVPYDAQKALFLLNQRGDDLPSYFDSVEDLTNVEEGTIRRDRLVLKPKSRKELLFYTKSEEA